MDLLYQILNTLSSKHNKIIDNSLLRRGARSYYRGDGLPKKMRVQAVTKSCLPVEM